MGVGGNGSHSSGSGTGRDFPPVFSWDWDGKRLIFVGVGRERFWEFTPVSPSSMYPSVEALSDTRYLNRASLSLRVRASVWWQRLSTENGARVPKHVQMINFHSMMVKLISQSTNHMRAKPWGLVHTGHGSSTIRCSPNQNHSLMCFFVVNWLLTSYKPNYYNLVITQKKIKYLSCLHTHSLVCKDSAKALVISEVLDG